MSTDNKIVIKLGSQSELKIQATRLAFAAEASRMPGQPQIEIFAIKAASEVNEQPFGYEETLRGARNRLANTKKDPSAAAATFVVTIENGILQFSDPNTTKPSYIDMPFVIVENLLTGKQYFTTGCGMPLSSDLVEEAQRRGFDKFHVGMLIYEKYGDQCNKNDPHSFLTAGRLSRVEMMVQVR